MDIEEVLGSTTRMRIMKVLVAKYAPYWLCELARDIGYKGTTGLSNHIKILNKAGLVRIKDSGASSERARHYYKTFVAEENNEINRFLRKLFNAAERV